MRKNPTPKIDSNQCLARPSTRGELAERLKKGEPCEVAAHVAGLTSSMLKAWLEVQDFIVIQSDNPGWVIYQPKASTD